MLVDRRISNHEWRELMGARAGAVVAVMAAVTGKVILTPQPLPRARPRPRQVWSGRWFCGRSSFEARAERRLVAVCNRVTVVWRPRCRAQEIIYDAGFVLPPRPDAGEESEYFVVCYGRTRDVWFCCYARLVDPEITPIW